MTISLKSHINVCSSTRNPIYFICLLVFNYYISISNNSKENNVSRRYSNSFAISKINNALIRKKNGRAILLQINIVVILSKQMRTVDQQLFEIQNKVRDGIATIQDHAILSKRVVKSSNDLKSLSGTIRIQNWLNLKII